MDISREGFLAWARDGARTVEERFGVLLLVEVVYFRFCYSAGLPMPDFMEEHKKREARRFNAGFEPVVAAGKLEFVAGKLGELRELEMGFTNSDRPLRDLSFLAFLPGLETLKLNTLEREDLEGVQHLAGLRKLGLWSNELEDYGALASCKELREVEVRTNHACPMLEGLDGLPKLEVFKWHGCVSALSSIGGLPALRYLQTGGNFYGGAGVNTVPDLRSLPEMPALEYLWGGWFYRLDGVERFPLLRFLMVMTFSKNLARLSVLKQLTHLRVSAPRLEGLEDVARMDGLLQFALYCEKPQDWGVVMESESLREVWHSLDYKTEVDLGMVRMVLPDYGEFFSAEEPRPLGPMRLVVKGSKEDPAVRDVAPSPAFPDGPGGWYGNYGMRESEARWVVETLREALREAGFLKLQGVRMEVVKVDAFRIFSTPPSPFARRIVSLTILKAEAIARMPGIFECMRLALSKMRNRWQVYVHVNAEPDADQWDEPWRKEDPEGEAEMEARNEAYDEFNRKRKRILQDDELRAKMHRELGGDMADFKPSPMPPNPEDLFRESAAKAEEEDDKDMDDDKEDDDSLGGIAEYDEETAEKDESWLPPVTISDPNKDWSGFSCFLTFDEQGIYMHAKNRGIESVCYLFDVVPERGD